MGQGGLCGLQRMKYGGREMEPCLDMYKNEVNTSSKGLSNKERYFKDVMNLHW